MVDVAAAPAGLNDSQPFARHRSKMSHDRERRSDGGRRGVIPTDDRRRGESTTGTACQDVRRIRRICADRADARRSKDWFPAAGGSMTSQRPLRRHVTACAAALSLALAMSTRPTPAVAHNGEAGGGGAPTVPPTLGPPAAGPQQPEQPMAPTPHATTGGTGDAWRRWWEAQADLLVPARPRVTTDAEGSRPVAPTGVGRTFRDAAHAEVVPTLLWAADPKRDFSTAVVCACYRSIGRLARDASDVEI